jgi:hypothetical protein
MTTEQTAAPQATETAPQAKSGNMPDIRPSKKQRDAMAAGGKPYVAEQTSATVDTTGSKDAGAVDTKTVPNGADDTPQKNPAASVDDTGQVDNTGAKTRTLKDLAAELKIDAKEIYSTVVPVGDNENMTIGELKDAYKQLAPKRERLEAIDRLEVEQRVERATMIRELDNIVKHLPPQALTAEYQNAVKQQMGMISQQETQKLLQIFPEWQEPMKYQTAVDGMLGAAQSYGLTPAEVANIVDHRWIQALHDLSVYQSKEKAAKTLLKDKTHLGKAPVNTSTAAQSGSASNSRPARNSKVNNRESQAERVAKLLN